MFDKRSYFFYLCALIPNLAFGVILIKGIYTFIKTGETILRVNTFGNALSDMTSILGSCLFRGVTGCGKKATVTHCTCDGYCSIMSIVL